MRIVQLGVVAALVMSSSCGKGISYIDLTVTSSEPLSNVTALELVVDLGGAKATRTVTPLPDGATSVTGSPGVHLALQIPRDQAGSGAATVTVLARSGDTAVAKRADSLMLVRGQTVALALDLTKDSSCQAGFTNCNGTWIDGCETHTTDDVKNCGQCGAICAVANGVAGCVAASCTIASCSGGFADCANGYADGCETQISKDVLHCGRCNTACPVPANSNAICAAGQCGIACKTGYGDCNKNVGDGCESDLAVDGSNCGTCGMVCGASTDGCLEAACLSPDYEWARWPMPNPAFAGLPNSSRYDGSDPGFIVDKVTGLTWQRQLDGIGRDQSGAGQYCKKLGLAGAQWRLPTKIELESLIDYTRTNPAIDPVFAGTTSASFWSSTLVTGVMDAAWGVNFLKGFSGPGPVQTQASVRCVVAK